MFLCLENHLTFFSIATVPDFTSHFDITKKPLPKLLNTRGAMTSCHKNAVDLGEPVSATLPCSCFLLDLSAFPASTGPEGQQIIAQVDSWLLAGPANAPVHPTVVSTSQSYFFHPSWGQLCLSPHGHTEGQWFLHHLS